MAKQLNVDVNLNTAQAEAKLKNLQNLLTQAITSSSKTSGGGLTREIVEATKAAADLKIMLNQAMNPSTGNLDLSRFSQQLSKSKTSLNDYAKSLTKLGPQGQQAFMSLTKSIVSAEVPMRESGKLLNELGTTFKNTLRWQATSSVIHNIVGGIQNAMSYARGLDSSLNSIRIVTGQSADQMDRFAKSANASAKALSASTLDYTDAALIYYQQGIRDEKEIKARTDATIKMANVTGDSAAKVSSQLTAIWNNFADGSTNLEYYADVITALGAATASSSAEISAGLQKFAAVADTVGLSYEYATSALATVVATTRQSADVVGTALKTLFARVQSLNLGETLDDGTTLGKYSKALDQVGISIKDQQGELRSMDDILDDMGNKWKTLNKDQQVALAQTVAGQRQYTQLVALMDNWDFMQENLKVAYGSEGTLQKQADIYAESWDAARTRVRAAAQGIFDDLISDKFFIGFNDALAGMLSGIDRFVDALGGIPGTLGLLGTVFTKVFSQQIGQGLERSIQSFKVFTGIAKVEAKSVREQAITASQTFTPGEGADKSLKMQSNSLQQQLVLANQYQSKMEAIAKAGGQVAASDKQRIASLMQIVELTQEAAIAAQQQVEASERSQSQANANIARNITARAIKKNGNKKLTKEQRRAIQERMDSLGVARQQLKEDYFAQSAYSRLNKNNYNLTASQLAGMQSFFKRQEEDYRIRAERARAREPNNLNAGRRLLRDADNFRMSLGYLTSGEYDKINKEYKKAQRKRAAFKGEDASALDAEVANLRSKLEHMGSQIKQALKSVSDDISMAEENALRDLRGESESTQKGFFDAIQEIVDSTNNAEDLEDQGEGFLEDTADAIESLNKESFSGLTQGLTGAMTGVSNLAMGFSSLKSGIEAINDESLSFGDKILQAGMSFGIAVPMITSGIGSMVTGFKGLKTHGASLISQAFLANTAAGFGQSSGYLAAVAGGTGAEFAGSVGVRKSLSGFINQRRFDKAALKALKQNPNDLRAAAVAGGGAIGQRVNSGDNADFRNRVQQLQAGQASGAAAGGLSMLQVAGLIAALTALALVAAKIKKDMHEASLDGKLEAAAAEGEKLTASLQEAKNAAEELKSTFDSYHSIADNLNKCTTGTQEWTEALRENNNEVLNLLSQYPELAKMENAVQRNADGSLSISEEAEQEMNRLANERIDTLSWAQLANQEKQAELRELINARDKGQEMANLMQQGKDYYDNGQQKIIENKSAFDPEISKGFSYAINEEDYAAKDRVDRNISNQKDANQKANELLIENWEDLQALEGNNLVNALGDIFTKNGLKVSTEDLGKYATEVQTSEYRGELNKLYNQQKAQQEAFEASQIGVMSNKLASEGILSNDAKTRDLVSNIFGKRLDERTAELREEDKQTYLRGGDERRRLAEEYVRAMGGDINSISFDSMGKLSYADKEGNPIEGVTAEMVASVTSAASALNELAGSAEAAAGAMKNISMTEGGEAIRDFLKDEDFSHTSANGLRELLSRAVSHNGVINADTLADNFIKSMGGVENATAIAAALGQELPDFVASMTSDLLNQQKWLNSTERAASIQAFKNRGLGADQLDNYSRAELEALQNYEDSKFNGPVKTLSELQTMAEAAGEAQQYLNRTWEDGTRLSADQAAGIKDIIQNQDLYNMAIDENTGKIKNAQLLQELLGDTINGVGIEAMRSQMPLYEQLNDLYDQLNKNAELGTNLNTSKQEQIISEIDLLEKEIATYQKLALVQSGALQAYDRIASGKEYDELNDYTDELEGALGSIYSHVEKDSNGNYDWSTMQWGSHEVQAAIEAIVPEDVRTGTNREGITTQQYLRDMYGDGTVGGRYRDKDGNITKANVDNFVNDMLGKTSNWGTFSGFLKGREGYSAQQLYEEGFSGLFLGVDEQGAVKQQGTIAEAAASMHMTESSFISMLSAAEKYNTSGTSYFSAFTAQGSDLATQLQFQTEAIKSSAEQVLNAKKELDEASPENKAAAQEKYTQAIQAQTDAIMEQKRIQKEAQEVGAKYKGLQEQLDAAETQEEVNSILAQMAELESQYGNLELHVSLVTDEGVIDNVKTQLNETFGEGSGLENYLTGGQGSELDKNLGDFWNGIAQQISGSDDIGKALQGAFGDAFKNVKYDQLPESIKNAFKANGLEDEFKSFVENGLEAVEEEAEDSIGENVVDSEAIITSTQEAVQSAIEEAQAYADANPIEYTTKIKGEGEGEGEGSKGTSSYTGSTSNDPSKDGFTTPSKKSKQQQQAQPSTVTVQVDVQGSEKVTEVTNAIASIPSTIPLSISGNITDVSDHIAALSGLLNTLGSAVPTLTIDTNCVDVRRDISEVRTAAQSLNQLRPRIAISSNAAAVLGSVQSLSTALKNLPSSKTIDITISVHGKIPETPAFGTAQAYGNAYANGQWGTGKGPVPALVGELGQELVVDPATGKFYTVGDTGAEFTVLPKNAIVFNHKQTEQLLKYRKINTRGQALAGGTQEDLINSLYTLSNNNAARQVVDTVPPGIKLKTAEQIQKDAEQEKDAYDERLQYQQEILLIIRQEVDVFKEVDRQLKKIEDNLKGLERNLNRLYGKDLMDLQRKTIDEMYDLYQEQKKATDYAKKINEEDKKYLSKVHVQWLEKVEDKDSKPGNRKFNENLASQDVDAFEMLFKYGGLKEEDVTRDAEGNIVDWNELAVDMALKYIINNARSTSNDWLAGTDLYATNEAEIENNKNYLLAVADAIAPAFQSCEESAEKIQEYSETAQDTLEEMHDRVVEMIQTEFETRKHLTDNELKRLDLKIKRLGDSVYKRAEILAWWFDKDNMIKATNYDQYGTHTKLGDWVLGFENAVKQYEDATTMLNNANKDDQQAYAITQAKWMDLSQASFDEISEIYDNLLEFRDMMQTYFADTIEMVTDELGKYTDQMGHYVSILDHMMNLMDLTGHKFDFDNKEIIIRGQMDTLKDDLETQTKWFEELDKNREEAERHLAEHAAEYSKEQYEQEYNNYVLPSIQAVQEAEEKKYEAAEKYLEKLEDLYQNAFDRINAEWEKLGSGGQGWDYLTGAIERAKSIQEEYLTTTNKLYETNTLMRKVQKDIDSSESSSRKESLKNFQKEIEMAQQDNKLAKSKMEILKARYEVLQAEMALEDAKNAKSVVRLQRDNEGNYGYVYTADSDAENDAEQNLMDKQNDLYNLALNYQNDYQEKSTQAMQEFQAKWMELEQQRKEGIIASDEELYAKQKELKAQYQEIFDAYNISMSESELVLNEVAAEGVSEAWSKSWEERRGNLTDFIKFSDDAHNELNGYLEEMNTVREEVVKNAKLGMDDVNKKTEELTNKSDALKEKIIGEVMPALDQEIDKVGELTMAYNEQYQELDALIQKLDEYLNKISWAQKEVAGVDLSLSPYDGDKSLQMINGIINGTDITGVTGARVSGEWLDNDSIIRIGNTMKDLGFESNNKDTDDTMYAISKQYHDLGITNLSNMSDEDLKNMISSFNNNNFSNNGLSLSTAMGDALIKEEFEQTKQNVKNAAEVIGITFSDTMKTIFGFDTGGYTGEWGSNGKLAILHEKELVLNKDDTSNFLKALEIAKESFNQLTQFQTLQSQYQQAILQSGLQDAIMTSFNQNTESLQQEVTIHADFPNVTERNEIAEAFKTLVNEASQFANRY